MENKVFRSGAPEIERVFKLRNKRIPGSYCAVCLRSDSERRLVDNANFKKFIMAVNLQQNWKPLQEPDICYMCNRQAVNALKFYQATQFASSINKIFIEILLREKDSIKNIFHKTHFKKLLMQMNMEDEKTLPSQWESELKIIRRRSQLNETRTLVIDSRVKVGDLDNIVNLGQDKFTTSVSTTPVQKPKESSNNTKNDGSKKKTKPTNEGSTKIQNRQSEGSSTQLEETVHIIDDPVTRIRPINTFISEFVLTDDEEEKDSIKVENVISDSDDTKSTNSVDCPESASVTSSDTQTQALMTSSDPHTQDPVTSNDPHTQDPVTSNDPHTQVPVTSNDSHTQVPVTSNDPHTQALMTSSETHKQDSVTSNDPHKLALMASSETHKQDSVTSNDPHKQDLVTSNDPHFNAPRLVPIEKLLEHPRILCMAQDPVTSNDPHKQALMTSSDPHTQDPVTSNDPHTQVPVTSNDPHTQVPVTLNDPHTQALMTSSDTHKQDSVTSNDPHKQDLVTSNDPHKQDLVTSNDPHFKAPRLVPIEKLLEHPRILCMAQDPVTSNKPHKQALMTSSDPHTQESVTSSDPHTQNPVTSNDPHKQDLVTSNDPSFKAPRLVPIENLLEHPTIETDSEPEILLHPILIYENGALTVPTIEAHIVDGQLITNNILLTSNQVMQNGHMQSLYSTVLPMPQTEANPHKRKVDMATQSKSNDVDMETQCKRKVLPVEAKPLVNKKIDWEDKIPMDVISFMDAVDPNFRQIPSYSMSPNIGITSSNNTSTSTSTETRTQDTSDCDIIDLC